MQDHVIHFYHLHALDWVDVVSALSADPAKTSSLAESISDWPLSSPKYFAGVRDRIKGFVDRGQLGPFANAYWGHPAYRLPAEANLMAVAHYLEALDWQREFIKMHAVLGGKNPHLQSFLVGGMATPIDPDSQAAINAGTIAELKAFIAEARDFVAQVYIPDLLAIASFYKDWAGHGGGVGNYLVFGDIPRTTTRTAAAVPAAGHHPRAATSPRSSRSIRRRSPSTSPTPGTIRAAATTAALHPFEGETQPNYTGPEPAVRAPRHRQEVLLAEVAALRRRADGSRTAGAHAGRLRLGPCAGEGAGRRRARPSSSVGPEALFSTLGRVAARGIETLLLAEKMDDWVDELAANMASGELRIHDNRSGSRRSGRPTRSGAGLPRGAARRARPLGAHPQRHDRQLPVRRAEHVERRTARRAGPPRARTKRRCIGTPVADPEQPIEILRTVHSFDPCMACGVHVVDARGARSRA